MTALRFLLLASGLLFSSLITAVFAQDEMVEMVTGLLGEKDKDMRALGFEQIRKEVKGEAATKKFADLLPKFPAETQIGLLSALADRGDTAAAPAVRKLLAESKDDALRVAAIKALGPLGGAEDLKALAAALAANAEAVRDAARDSLIRLPADASAGMIADLKDSPSAVRIALLQILTTRRAHEAIPAMLETASGEDAKARQAALAALAELGDAETVPNLAQLALKAAAGRERETVEKTIATVCQRNPDKQDRAAPLLAVMQKSKDAERTVLLSTLGRVGGPAALRVADDAAEASNSELHAAGIRAWCNWPDGATVSRLLKTARTESDAELRKAAFQALVRIAPLADERDDRRRLDTLRTVLAMCANDAERNQVLDRAKAIRNIDTLRFLLPFFEQPKFAQQACLTTVELAHHSSLRESNKDEFMRALDQVKKISTDPVVIDRANRYQTGQTWLRPKNAE